MKKPVYFVITILKDERKKNINIVYKLLYDTIV